MFWGWNGSESDGVNRMVNTASELSHKFSKLWKLDHAESTVPQFCSTPGCPVQFGQQEKIQEGCWDWWGGMVNLRANRMTEVKFVFMTAHLWLCSRFLGCGTGTYVAVINARFYWSFDYEYLPQLHCRTKSTWLIPSIYDPIWQHQSQWGSAPL